MASKTQKHALVAGASGISGWALVNTLLSEYPEAAVFTKITALTNRPLSQEMSQWPEDPRLEVISGIDLLKGSQSDLEKELSTKIKNVDTVTHMYYFSYKFDPDPDKESRTNMDMVKRFVVSLDNLSPDLEFIVLPTGTKTYGVHLLHDNPLLKDVPHRETLPRLPEPYASKMFYYWLVDAMTELSKEKKWTWCEIRPDNIVGFVPNNNTYCLAQTLAIYLALYVYINGKGSTVSFPGTETSYKALNNDTSQDILGKFTIYASLHGDKAGAGRAFNICHQDTPSSWSLKWPVICDFFGLVGTGPEPKSPQPGAYVVENRAKWDEMAEKYRLRSGVVDNNLSLPGFQYFIMTMFDFDRQISMEAAREIGFTDKMDTKEAWWGTLERFRKAKVIP